MGEVADRKCEQKIKRSIFSPFTVAAEEALSAPPCLLILFRSDTEVGQPLGKAKIVTPPDNYYSHFNKIQWIIFIVYKSNRCYRVYCVPFRV